MVATRREPERVHFAALDGYRAAAALGVVLLHIALLSGYANRTEDGVGAFLARGDVGVSVFFLLSGFLLHRPFVAARLAGRPTMALSAYVRRRLLRIFPAYWVALLLIAYVLRAPSFEGPHEFWPHFLLLHVYDVDQQIGGPIQQSWTLATELSFYAFLPAWVWLLGRRERTPERQVRVELGALVALWAGAHALKLSALAAGVSDANFGWFSIWLPFRIDEFALGMGLAVLSAWFVHTGERPRWLRSTATVAACWVGAAAVFWFLCTQLDLPIAPLFTARQNYVVRLLYSLVALLLIVPGTIGRRDSGPVRSVFANPVMIWLGLISYGIYIWHEAFQDLYLRWFDEVAFGADPLAMGLVTMALTVPVSAASFYLVERPAMRFRRSTPLPGPMRERRDEESASDHEAVAAGSSAPAP